jgi:hypothetical protein
MSEFKQIALLKRKNKIAVAPSTGEASDELMFALNANLAHLGYTLSGNLMRVLKTLDEPHLGAFYDFLVEQLKAIVGADVTYKPLFKNFPDQVDSTGIFYYKRNIGFLQNLFDIEPRNYQVLDCGHIVDTDLFGQLSEYTACPVCGNQLEALDTPATIKLPPMEKITPFKVLDLASADDLYQIFTDLLGANSSISQGDRALITELFVADGDAVVQYLPDVIPFKEQLALAVALCAKHAPSGLNVLAAQLKTATDCLRMAVIFSGGDASLVNKKFNFKLSNPQRRLVLSALDKIASPLEDMLRYRSLFLRLGKCLHVGTMTKRFNRAAKAFDTLRNDHKSIDTYAGQVERLSCQLTGRVQTPSGTLPVEHSVRTEDSTATLEDNLDENQVHALVTLKTTLEDDVRSPDMSACNEIVGDQSAAPLLLALLASRAGEFARRLDFLLSYVADKHSVIAHFSTIVSALPTPMLLQISKHMERRTQPESFRYFMPKGAWSKTQVINGDKRPILDNDTVAQVLVTINEVLLSRFGEKKELGRIFVDPELKNYLIPLSMRSASDSMVTLARGSRVKVSPKAGLLRVFQYWKGDIDLDLSVVAFNDSWQQKGECTYYSEGKKGDWAHHSGDILSAPLGAAECIDIDIEATKSMGIRYCVMFINVFSGQSFFEFDALAGIMERPDDKTGELFEPSAVSQKFHLSGEVKGTVPLILDLHTMEYIWMDIAINSAKAFSNAATTSEETHCIGQVASVITQHKPNLYDLFMLHAKARAQQVDNQLDPDIEYDMILDKSMATQYETILANWVD